MRHYRPLKPDEEQALQSIYQDADAHREALRREIFELEQSRVPIYRLALERMFFRQLVAACRRLPHRNRALQRILDRIPHASSSQEWAKMAEGERLDAMLEAQRQAPE